MKVVLNSCYGGFGFSKEFLALHPEYERDWQISRNDANLIAALEDFGLEAASDDFSRLRIEEIPDEATDWEIDEYDGMESIICVVNGKLRHL